MSNTDDSGIKPYDSTVDTQKHIDRVSELLSMVCAELTTRANKHDASKLVGIEETMTIHLTRN